MQLRERAEQRKEKEEKAESGKDKEKVGVK